MKLSIRHFTRLLIIQWNNWVYNKIHFFKYQTLVLWYPHNEYVQYIHIISEVSEHFPLDDRHQNLSFEKLHCLTVFLPERRCLDPKSHAWLDGPMSPTQRVPWRCGYRSARLWLSADACLCLYDNNAASHILKCQFFFPEGQLLVPKTGWSYVKPTESDRNDAYTLYKCGTTHYGRWMLYSRFPCISSQRQHIAYVNLQTLNHIRYTL